jgi:hypothetical protein
MVQLHGDPSIYNLHTAYKLGICHSFWSSKIQESMRANKVLTILPHYHAKVVVNIV